MRINGDACVVWHDGAVASPSSDRGFVGRTPPNSSRARRSAPAPKERQAIPSTFTVLLKRTLHQSSKQKRLQALQILLLTRVRPTGPLLQIEVHRTVQQADGIHIQIELKRGGRIGHPPIATRRPLAQTLSTTGVWAAQKSAWSMRPHGRF